MPIKILSDQTIAQIAAGEVVERPASVVKELVENALDAGATHLHVTVSGGGQKLIRINDNGSGILAGEVELAFARHATSKLATIDDLLQIRTLGFRGEALASIASVSQVMVTTRHRQEEVGTQIRVEGGTVTLHQSAGAPAGTVISVENLFYNTPARLKFLKAESTEKRHITTTMTRYAMAYPHVRFILEQDGRELLRTGGSGQLADVVVKVLGLENFRQMVALELEESPREERPAVRVWGYTSMPEFYRADRSHIVLFVNGRHIQDSTLTYAVIQAYHTLLMTGRFPVAIVMIEIDPQEVDVNVHPAKAEVRFRNPNAVFSAVQRAVRQAVVTFSAAPGIRSGRSGGLATARPEAVWGGEEAETAAQLDMDLALEATGQYPRQRSPFAQEQPAPEDDPTAVPVGLGAPLKPRTLPMLRVVGQVGAMYIVAEGPAGLYLIDQHAAHERILYEQFMENFSKQEVTMQHMLVSQTVRLAPAETQLVETNLDALQAIGFVLEPFGPNTFVIRAVPGLLADSDPADVIAGLMDDLEQGKKPGHSAIEEKLIMQVCRQAAVKAGQVLNYDEMQGMIRQLERCSSPHTCPHGRPTMIHLSGERLAREFGRI